MRLPSLFAIALVLVAPTLTHADTVLVGSDLFLPGGSALCPNAADCLQIAQQVTFFTPVTIDQIKVGITGPDRLGFSDGSFNVILGPVLGAGMEIGPGDLVFDPNGPRVFITRLLFYRVTTAAQLAPINQKTRLAFF